MIKDIETKLEISNRLTQILEIISMLENNDYDRFHVDVNNKDDLVYSFNVLSPVLATVKTSLIKELRGRAVELEVNLRNTGY